jgi:hypothetical protein
MTITMRRAPRGAFFLFCGKKNQVVPAYARKRERARAHCDVNVDGLRGR